VNAVKEAPPAIKPIRLLVADDQALFRIALVDLLNKDPRLTVVGQAGDGLAVVQRALELQPDVVLMDIRCLGSTGSRRRGRSWPSDRASASSC
jgi:DNA-binding NarL/FixJ family response regulator